MWAIQVSASEGEEATQRALAIISAAPPDDARRMARMVLSAVDATDNGRFAEKFIELNLALGNTSAAISAAADAAVAEQRRGEYKVLHDVSAPHTRICEGQALSCARSGPELNCFISVHLWCCQDHS